MKAGILAGGCGARIGGRGPGRPGDAIEVGGRILRMIREERK